MARNRLVVLTLPAVLMVSACGDGIVDPQQVVDDLPAAILPGNPQLVDDVVCPEGVEPTDDETVWCSATIAGDPIDLEIRAAGTGVDDDIEVDVAQTLLNTRRLADDAAIELGEQLDTTVSMNCDVEAVIVAQAGRAIRCTAIDDGDHPLTLRLIDDSGDYEIELGSR